MGRLVKVPARTAVNSAAANKPAPAALTLTPDLYIEAAGGGFRELSGFTAQEVQGKPLASILGAGTEPASNSLPELLRTDSTGPVNLHLLARGGARIPVVFQCLALSGLAAETRLVILRAASPDEAPETDGLRITQDQFVSNISHEMRTPLSGIAGMADLLNDSELAPMQREFVSVIRACTQELTAFVDDVLDYSRLSQAQVELEAKPFRLVSILENVVGTTAPKDKKLEVYLQLDPVIPQDLVGDAARLRQVLLHLVGNAVKFTPQGEVRIRVTLHESRPKQAVLLFSIRDTGIGVQPGSQHLIFEPFQQQDSTTTRPYRGTGLGLTLSRQLVELMGGDIWLESDPGWGTEVYFTAPLTLRGARAPLPDTLLLAKDNELNRRNGA